MKKLLLFYSFSFCSFLVNAQQKLKYSPLPATGISHDWLEKKIDVFKTNSIYVLCDADAIPKNEYDVAHSFLVLKKQSVVLILFNKDGNSYIMKESLPTLKKGENYEAYYLRSLYTDPSADATNYEILNHKKLHNFMLGM